MSLNQSNIEIKPYIIGLELQKTTMIFPWNSSPSFLLLPFSFFSFFLLGFSIISLSSLFYAFVSHQYIDF